MHVAADGDVYARSAVVKTSVDEIGKNKVRLSVEVPASDIEPFLARTYKRLAAEIRVPGFRPGKAPRRVIDQRLGKDFVRSEALREALPELVAEALEESKLDVVSPPEIDVTSFDEGADLAFDALVETRPAPELKDYAGLPATRPAVSVGEDEVQDQIERLRVRFASLEVAERPAQEGEFALVDLRTYRHDETIDELTAKDLLLEVGAEMVVPELDAELVGKRKGDILKVTATLPERFGERAGWQVGMQVLVKEIKVRKLPELDDDFATTVSEFDTLDELRADVRERIREAKEQRARSALRESVIESFLASAVDVDLPDGMVVMETDELIRSLARLLAAQGASIEQYMQAEDLDVDALRQRMRPQAERNITLALGLDAVAAAEGLEATDEDRASEVQKIADRVGQSPEDVRSAIDEGGDWGSVDGDIIRSKALDLLVERADVTEEEHVAGEEASSAGDGASEEDAAASSGQPDEIQAGVPEKGI